MLVFWSTIFFFYFNGFKGIPKYKNYLFYIFQYLCFLKLNPSFITKNIVLLSLILKWPYDERGTPEDPPPPQIQTIPIILSSIICFSILSIPKLLRDKVFFLFLMEKKVRWELQRTTLNTNIRKFLLLRFFYLTIP